MVKLFCFTAALSNKHSIIWVNLYNDRKTRLLSQSGHFPIFLFGRIGAVSFFPIRGNIVLGKLAVNLTNTEFS